MTQRSGNEPDRVGPADDVEVPQSTGAGEGAAGAGGHDEAPDREFGVRGAVERGPAETSSEGAPVRDNPNISLEDREPARSTDDL